MKLHKVQTMGSTASICTAALFLCGGPLLAAPTTITDPQASYNEGVNKLSADELGGAEKSFLDAVESNHEQIQPVALYNLGHVRFLQGKETIEGQSNRQQLLDASATATMMAVEIIRRVLPIAELDDVQALIQGYMQARSARKQLRLTRDENTRTLGLIDATLERWRRSVGNFHSAAELDPSNQDANANADLVERHIAKLLEFKKQLEEKQENVGQQREKLKELMKKMRGKIPKEMQRGSDEEEDDEDEEEPQDEEGKKEKETAKQQQQRIGSEREIDPDMLRVLKEKLPQRTMSVGQEGEREMEGFRPDGQKPGQAPGPDGQRTGPGQGPEGQRQGTNQKGKKGRDW